MKLNDVLSVISGGTYIIIYADLKEVFCGKMTHVNKKEWDKYMSDYVDREVIRINTMNGAITIAV